MQQKRHIQILKASLPYMHSPLREACRICVRMFELQQAMHRLDEEEESLELDVRGNGCFCRGETGQSVDLAGTVVDK